MRPLAFRGPKNRGLWIAIARGFQAELRHHSFCYDPNRLSIIGGLAGNSPGLLASARARGGRYVFVDNGYFATHDGKHRVRYRMVPDAYAHYWVNQPRSLDMSRFNNLNVAIKPWRHHGRHILICKSSAAHAAFFGLEDWAERTKAELEQYTDRPIRIREKPPVRERISPDLRDCWAVVAWSSKAAIDAAMAGIPVFVGPESPALPIANTDLSLIETPLRPDREAWAASLAWGQFTIPEIQSGLAAELCSEWALEHQPREVAA